MILVTMIMTVKMNKKQPSFGNISKETVSIICSSYAKCCSVMVSNDVLALGSYLP